MLRLPWVAWESSLPEFVQLSTKPDLEASLTCGEEASTFGKQSLGPDENAFISHRISLALGALHSDGSWFTHTDPALYCAEKSHP